MRSPVITAEEVDDPLFNHVVELDNLWIVDVLFHGFLPSRIQPLLHASRFASSIE
jgi:hypothetical protein